jgi:tRNA(Ile)-lysidine synthase
MLAQLHNYIAEKNLIKKGDRLLLAVSGGIDSMVMSHLFLHLPYEFGIAHCNFSLRGTESDGDEMLVKTFCSEHNIPFHTVKFDTTTYARNNGLSIQMAARELRYRWFEEVRSGNGYDLIAIAHNLNDNIETLLINLTRGTGPAGLSGIKVTTGNIIRPLMFASREMIGRYCEENNIKYREDSSNAETKYTRNKIRHKILPVLKEINPSVEATLTETTDRFAEVNDIISEYLDHLRRRISHEKDGNIFIETAEIKKHIKNKTVIFGLFRPYSLNTRNIDEVIKLIGSRTGVKLYTETHRLVKDRNNIIVSPLENLKNTDEKIFRNISELARYQDFDSAEIKRINDYFPIPQDPSIACLDRSAITFPLVIRKWQPGDYFFPLGMKKRKKLSDYFIDKKYSIPEKENKKVLESDGKIAWIIGDRIDDRFRITDHTTEALIIRTGRKYIFREIL